MAGMTGFCVASASSAPGRSMRPDKAETTNDNELRHQCQAVLHLARDLHSRSVIPHYH